MEKMEKAYKQLVFKNKKRPALNEDNLNRISTAVNTIDDRVIELNEQTEKLKEDVQIYRDLSVEGIGYIKALGQFFYWTGDGHHHDLDPISPEDIGAVTAEELDTRINGRLINGQIDSGIVSNSLVKYGITKDDTAFAVFNKLPQASFAMINSNAQSNNYAHSFPDANAKGCTLFYKYYDNRGWMEFHSYDDPGNVYHAKVLDGQISGWQKILNNKNVLTTEEQLNVNTEAGNVVGATLVKDMFNNIFKKVFKTNINIGPRWGRTIETEYCELIGNVIHAKFKINQLYLQGTQWMATINLLVQRPSVTIGEAVAYVPETEAYYPLAVFPSDTGNFLTIGYLEGMPVYTSPNGTTFKDAIITAKIAVSPA